MTQATPQRATTPRPYTHHSIRLLLLLLLMSSLSLFCNLRLVAVTATGTNLSSIRLPVWTCAANTVLFTMVDVSGMEIGLCCPNGATYNTATNACETQGCDTTTDSTSPSTLNTFVKCISSNHCCPLNSNCMESSNQCELTSTEGDNTYVTMSSWTTTSTTPLPAIDISANCNENACEHGTACLSNLHGYTCDCPTTDTAFQAPYCTFSCPAGRTCITFPDLRSVSYQSVPCAAGNFCTGASSTPNSCPLGSYCPIGSSAPTICPKGAYCPTLGLSAPIKCKSGTICNQEGLIDAGACPIGSVCKDALNPTPCPKGYYCPKPGLSEAIPCEAGTYAPTTGLTECIDLPPGTYAPAQGASTATPCPENHYCSKSVSDSVIIPRTCEVGQVSDVGSSTCHSCTTFWRTYDTNGREGSGCQEWTQGAMGIFASVGVIGIVSVMACLFTLLRYHFKQTIRSRADNEEPQPGNSICGIEGMKDSVDVKRLASCTEVGDLELGEHQDEYSQVEGRQQESPRSYPQSVSAYPDEVLDMDDVQPPAIEVHIEGASHPMSLEIQQGGRYAMRPSVQDVFAMATAGLSSKDIEAVGSISVYTSA